VHHNADVAELTPPVAFLWRSRRPLQPRHLARTSYGQAVPDKLFSQSELAQLYDPFDPDRGDLDAYVEILEELGASSVLDVGCGTGTFALMLAERGFAVTGLDPANPGLSVGLDSERG